MIAMGFTLFLRDPIFPQLKALKMHAVGIDLAIVLDCCAFKDILCECNEINLQSKRETSAWDVRA
jgi:hypothetical protein